MLPSQGSTVAAGPLCTAANCTGSNPQHWLRNSGLPDEPGLQREQEATEASSHTEQQPKPSVLPTLPQPTLKSWAQLSCTLHRQQSSAACETAPRLVSQQWQEVQAAASAICPVRSPRATAPQKRWAQPARWLPQAAPCTGSMSERSSAQSTPSEAGCTATPRAASSVMC